MKSRVRTDRLEILFLDKGLTSEDWLPDHICRLMELTYYFTKRGYTAVLIRPSTLSCPSANIFSIEGMVAVVLDLISAFIRRKIVVGMPNCFGASFEVYREWMSDIMVVNSSRSTL